MLKDVSAWVVFAAIVSVLGVLFKFGDYLLKSYNIAKKIDNLFLAVQENTDQIKEVKDIAKGNREANRYFAANILYTRCHEYLDLETITEAEYRYLYQFYKVYSSLGGNSGITLLWNQTTILAKKCGVDVDLILKGA